MIRDGNHLLFIGERTALSFYDIDKDYARYLQESEKEERGFTRVPDVEYPGKLPKSCRNNKWLKSLISIEVLGSIF